MKIFRSAFRSLFLKKETANEKKDIRYAHPSHDPKNKPKPKPAPDTKGNDADKNHDKYVRPRKTKSISAYDRAIGQFDNFERVIDAVYKCLLIAGPEGRSSFDLNGCVSSILIENPKAAKSVLANPEIKEKIYKACKALQSRNSISFNSYKRIWHVRIDDIDGKKGGNIPGTKIQAKKSLEYPLGRAVENGWHEIDSPKHAIGWIYENLSPEEFENFCIAILKHCGVSEITRTAKRAYSGADGGLDGTGKWILNGRPISIAFQAKKHNPDKQLGDNEIRVLFGTMKLYENPISHGFLITTATFSKKLLEKKEAAFKEGIEIELVDQNVLVKMMTVGDGYGLRVLPSGACHINPFMLRRAGSS